MLVTKEYLCQAIKLLLGDKRFRLGLVSVVSWLCIRHVIWTALPRWEAKRKYKARKLQADAFKSSAIKQSHKSKNPDLMKQPLEALVNAVKSGQVTALELLMAMTNQALAIDQEINAVTEPILEAVDQAKRLDASPDKQGLLYGIPVSIKENIGLKDYDSTAAMAARINIKMEEDAVAVKVLKHHGAVPFVRTNVAQFVMSFTSTNPLYGTTLNAHNKTRGAGGSSCGEGALIGGGGSIIGIGSDVGGSIRCPGDFNGIYTLKTTVGRISKKGVLAARRGRQAIEGSVGPMARDFDSLLLISRALMSDEMYTLDPTLAPLPFNEQLYSQKEPLRIGYFTYDGNVRCQPPNIRAVIEAKEALQRKGHQVIEINFPESFGYDAGNVYFRILMGDRADGMLRDTFDLDI